MTPRKERHEAGITHRVSGRIYMLGTECPVLENSTEGHDLAVTAQILQPISPREPLKYICTVDYKAKHSAAPCYVGIPAEGL